MAWTMTASLTGQARRAVDLAGEEGGSPGRRLVDSGQQVGTEHILSALLSEDDGLALMTMAVIGVDLDQARRQAAQLLEAPDPPA